MVDECAGGEDVAVLQVTETVTDENVRRLVGRNSGLRYGSPQGEWARRPIWACPLDEHLSKDAAAIPLSRRKEVRFRRRKATLYSSPNAKDPISVGPTASETRVRTLVQKLSDVVVKIRVASGVRSYFHGPTVHFQMRAHQCKRM